jgi:hypothetical protein
VPVVAKLPLDSPAWGELSACWSVEKALGYLKNIVASGRLGDAWEDLRDEILHQGTVYGATSAALPYLVDVAAGLDPGEASEFWVETGYLVVLGAGRFPGPPPADGLQEGLTAALATAEELAVRGFLAADLDAAGASYHALACVALAGHPVGSALESFLSPSQGYVAAECPGCGEEYELDGFGDPLGVPCAPPPVPDLTGRSVAAWAEVAAAVEAAGRDAVLGPGWDGFFEVATAVARAGVPAGTPNRAVWCLVAAMVAVQGEHAWARTLARLVGYLRCEECDEVWPLADAVGEVPASEPADVADLDEATVADFAGFKPAPVTGHVEPVTAEGLRVEPAWQVDAGPVRIVAAVPVGDRTVLAAGGADGTVRLFDPDSGDPVSDPFRCRVGAVTCLAAVVLPDGSAVLAVGGEAPALDWWDLAAGRPLGEPVPTGAGPVLAMATLVMPAENSPVATWQPNWLTPLRDGRQVLATGDTGGAVLLWDAAGREPLGEAFRREGTPVVAMTALDHRDASTWSGGGLVTVYGDRTVDVWNSPHVHGKRATERPTEKALAKVGYEHLVAAAPAAPPAGRPMPVLLADRDGTVSVWGTVGVRFGDPLPADPEHRPVLAVASLELPGGRTVVATLAGGATPGLRLWEPVTGGARSVALDVNPRALAVVGDRLAVGHDAGLLALAVTG